MTTVRRLDLEVASGSAAALATVESRVIHTSRATHISRTIAERRSRYKFFPAEIFSDPAWDILLELYASEVSQIRITISKLCAAVPVPVTTAMRWISALEREGLICRRKDPVDGRRVFVALSAKGIGSMDAYFESSESALNSASS